jgi:hypothetical protein
MKEKTGRMRYDSSKTKHLSYVMPTCDAFQLDAEILNYMYVQKTSRDS